MNQGVSQYFSMEWPLVKTLLCALLLFVQIHEHRGCIEEERTGLLELKSFLESNTNSTDPFLPSWVNEAKSECCGWERVRCNATTGHVIELSLDDLNREYDGFYSYMNHGNSWFFNVSLLLPFKELRILDLSENGISGWLGNEGM
ncbi:receptor like protein 21-like [Fagus crenata]